MLSNASKLKFARGAVYAWLAVVIGLFVAGPFLPQPFRTYVAHACYFVLFGGIAVGVAVVKVWIGPYMPDRSSKTEASSPAPLNKSATSRMRVWNILAAATPLAALLVLPRFGVRLDREQIYAAALAVVVVSICAYYGVRHVRQRRI